MTKKTKTNAIYYLVFALIVALSITGCKESEENELNPKDPEGTKSLFFKVPEYSYTWHVAGRDIDIYTYTDLYWLDSGGPHIRYSRDYNFECSDEDIAIADIGKVNGLGGITQKPTSGWSSRTAVSPNEGYVVRIGSDPYTYGRLYVVSDNGNGVQVKYQYPF